ncbi:glycosyl hydrolase family 18 family protein [Firmicutes bacterium CAG:238]|jgi:hypothetical protein|nr:glycosyl hydrolase family 18 family protein [Firmicutes bacterium CAG:238]
MKHADLVAFLKAARLTADDNTALTGMELYPVWAVGIAVAKDSRYQYNSKLYKVVQAHTTQADWTPDIAPALWAVIDAEHAGTLEDPIPAVAGMEYIKGKYYIEGETIYLMNREGMADGESVVLHYLPSQLVGQYFEAV